MTRRREIGPRSRDIVAQERRHIAPGLQSFALTAGVAMARGEGCTLIDEDGNEYIDFIAGIGVGSVGHCHPHYVESLKRQLERLTFGSFTTETRARFLSQLASLTPEGLTRIQLFSGGAEAVEAALRLAKAATGKHEVLGFWGGFHGKTGGVLGLLGSDFKHHLGPFMPGRYVSPYADCYRCPLKLRFPECGIACADFLRDVIRYQTGGEISAIIVEPIQGTAGNVVPPSGFLRAVQAIAKEHDALFIADEMLTGFGRTGAMWGSYHDGVVPDVMTIGKGMGGGFPLSAVISTESLTNRVPWSNPSASSSSYGGNPLAAAAGLATLEILIKEDLVRNAERVGQVMLRRLEALKEKHRCVGEVRGKGLMLGIELVSDRQTREPLAKDVTRALYQECLRRGLVAMTYAPSIRINPPLVIREDTALAGLAILDEALEAVGRAHGLSCRMLRGGIIGLGNVAIEGHLPGWTRRDDVEIVALSDTEAARRQPAEARLPAARWYDSVEDLLAHEPLDFVDICTPPASHGLLVCRALERGLHVLCEKPLVVAPDDLTRVARLAEETRRVVHTVVEDTATVQVTFPHATADIFLTWAADRRDNVVELIGTDGRIDLHEETLRLQRDGRERQWSCPPALSMGSAHPDWFDPEVNRFLGEVTGAVERDGNLAEARLCSVLESLARDSDRRGGQPLALPSLPIA